MNIIGLTGSKFHGKDTVADLIQKYGTNRVVRLSFAEPIKKALSVIHVIPYNYFDDPKLKELPLPQWGGRTPRQLAQWFGTDIYRNQFDREIWLKNMLMRIEKYNSEDCTIVVTDCRFDNEIEFVRNIGGVIWKVDASLRVPPSGDSHESENGVSVPTDIVIDNNGSYRELEELVKSHLM